MQQGDSSPQQATTAARLDEALAGIKSLLDTLTVTNRHVDIANVPIIESVDVRQLFGALAPMLEAQARSAGKDITWRSSVAEVCIDRNRLMRIITNLVSNAMKYSAGQRILVICRPVGDDIVLRVYDQGPGLTEEELVNVLQPTKKRRMALNKPGEGVGLGVCLDIVHGYGGELEAASRPQGATMFGVRLPRPNLQQVATSVEFLGEPQLWQKFAAVLNTATADHTRIKVFSENVDPGERDGVHIVACYDRGIENTQHWGRRADAILHRASPDQPPAPQAQLV